MIYGQLGRLDEARAAIAELTALYPGYADVARTDLEKWIKDEALVSATLGHTTPRTPTPRIPGRRAPSRFGCRA